MPDENIQSKEKIIIKKGKWLSNQNKPTNKHGGNTYCAIIFVGIEENEGNKQKQKQKQRQRKKKERKRISRVRRKRNIEGQKLLDR